MRTVILLVLLSTQASSQDHGVVTARPPQDAEPLPPVQEPFRTPVERRDLLQQFLPTTGIEGFYELRRVVRGGRAVDANARGYLAIGHNHLSIHLVTPRQRGEAPFLQSGFRRYRLEGDRLTTFALIGHSNAAGTRQLVFEPTGFSETRTIERLGPLLRVKQGATSYLEFARLE